MKENGKELCNGRKWRRMIQLYNGRKWRRMIQLYNGRKLYN
jgi:hypothetical protein